MPRKTFRPIAAGDIARLAAAIRAEDRAEVEAVFGPDMGEAIGASVLHSSHVWVCEVDGELACIFGVGPISLLTGSGRPWMLGTEVLDRYPVSLVKGVRRYIRRMLELYPRLENWVDSRNTRHVTLLRQLGFRIDPPVPFGPQGIPFHRFELRVA